MLIYEKEKEYVKIKSILDTIKETKDKIELAAQFDALKDKDENGKSRNTNELMRTIAADTFLENDALYKELKASFEKKFYEKEMLRIEIEMMKRNYEMKLAEMKK